MGLPLQPIFKRNHVSFENNPATTRVILKIITQWFDAGTLEYVCRWHCLPQCIFACSSVDKATEPFLSLGDRWPAHQCLRIRLAGQVHHGRGSVPKIDAELFDGGA
jgi:hypothetical protein